MKSKTVWMMLLGILLLGGATLAQAQIDVKTYFPLNGGDWWHYTGAGNDDFQWETLTEKKSVPGGEAWQIFTETDDDTDDRNGDKDYWAVNESGELVFWGFYNAEADGTDIPFPAQDIVLEESLLAGGSAQQIGDVVNDEAPFNGVNVGTYQDASGIIASEVRYVSILPSVTTPLGTFNNVLKVALKITIKSVKISTPLGDQQVPVNYTIRESYFYLKQNVGMVMQGQNADEDDAMFQRVDSGNVNGTDVTGDGGQTEDLVADFTGTPLTGTAPLQVTFTNTSTGEFNEVEWDADNDGTVDGTTTGSYTHTYNEPGTYSVKLWVGNDTTSDTETKQDYITVTADTPALDAAFSADPLTGTAPLEVHFTDGSTGSPTGWSWDFDNDGQVDSTEQNPTYTYSSAGTYSVSLTVSDGLSTDTETNQDYITVTEASGGDGDADIDFTLTADNSPMAIDFQVEYEGYSLDNEQKTGQMSGSFSASYNLDDWTLTHTRLTDLNISQDADFEVTQTQEVGDNITVEITLRLKDVFLDIEYPGDLTALETGGVATLMDHHILFGASLEYEYKITTEIPYVGEQILAENSGEMPISSEMMEPVTYTTTPYQNLEEGYGLIGRISIDDSLSQNLEDGVSVNLAIVAQAEGQGAMPGEVEDNGPENDDFANATPIEGVYGNVRGNNEYADRETGEPHHAELGTAEKTVWFKWTAPQDGPVRFDTNGSNFDTYLAAYTGSDLHALESIAASDDYDEEAYTIRSEDNDLWSLIQFDAAKDTTYHIMVGSYHYEDDDSEFDAEYGDYVLSWSYISAAPEMWVENFGADDSWQMDRHPRYMGDLNGDGLDDIAGYADGGVMVALSTGSGFTDAAIWVPDFGYKKGWRIDQHPRYLIDLDNDGRDDCIGFGNGGVLVSLSLGNAFTPSTLWLDNFGAHQGWSTTQHPRMLKDVNNDHYPDCVGFGNAGVFVALNQNGAGFDDATLWLDNFGANDSWTVEQHVRDFADVNGDGMADCVGYADKGVMVALSTGQSFAPANLWLLNFGANDGWQKGRHPRVFADVNMDGKADVVGFGDAGVQVGLSEGDHFAEAQRWVRAFGTNHGWDASKHLRMVTPLSVGGPPAIIGFKNTQVWAAVSNGTSFGVPGSYVTDFCYDQGWRVDKHPRFIKKVRSGSNLMDIIGIGDKGVLVY